MMVRSESAEADAIERNSRCSGLRSVSSASSSMPSTPFIGVRISWLMLARNSLFDRFAASATSFAASSSSLACDSSAVRATTRSSRCLFIAASSCWLAERLSTIVLKARASWPTSRGPWMTARWVRSPPAMRSAVCAMVVRGRAATVPTPTTTSAPARKTARLTSPVARRDASTTASSSSSERPRYSVPSIRPSVASIGAATR